MPNVSNVSTGKPKVAGAVFFADVGTTLPTDASSALAAGFADLGYVSENGVTNTNTSETDTLRPGAAPSSSPCRMASRTSSSSL